MTFSDPRATTFEEHRGLLTGVAYRMLGSVSDAEDMVQEAWLRWTGADTAEVRSPKSWLLTVVSRLCLDRMKSARVQREQYYGTWLPEPYVDVTAEQASVHAAQVDESVSIALMLVLEKLSPEERAGFLLHEVFGHSYEEISDILGKPAVNCRKMVSRARERVRSEKPRFTTTHQEHEELLKKFLEACRAGELEPLLNLLGEHASLHSDGGGKATAVPKVLRDRNVIAKFFLNVVRAGEASAEGFETRLTTFNGAPGLLLLVKGHPVTALSLDVQDGKIHAIFAHRNPDKLRLFEQQGGRNGHEQTEE